jgi:hypothetical protein
MTKAKQLLLESSLIAKDMEILVLKEKIDLLNRDLLLEMLRYESMEDNNEDLQQQLAKIPNWIKWLFI